MSKCAISKIVFTKSANKPNEVPTQNDRLSSVISRVEVCNISPQYFQSDVHVLHSFFSAHLLPFRQFFYFCVEVK